MLGKNHVDAVFDLQSGLSSIRDNSDVGGAAIEIKAGRNGVHEMDIGKFLSNRRNAIKYAE